MFEGLRKPVDLIVIVVTLLSYGCPVQAILQDDRDWMSAQWLLGEIEQGVIVNRSIRHS